MPLRKIAPDRIALSSYYGKTFITRSSKKVNDYGQWLRNNIMVMGLDDTNPTVTNLHPGDVFDNLFPAPKLFTALAMGFRGFTLNVKSVDGTFRNLSFDVTFDPITRKKLFSDQARNQYDIDGSLIIGKDYSEQYLIMDKHGILFHTEANGGLTQLGTIESVLGLESIKAPVEFCNLTVMGEQIPVGVVLGYELGLDKLMHMLKVEPRRVPAGTRVNLQDNEYTLVFSDETLVFDRKDKRASMILAGFNEYHKAIRQYSVYEFNRRGVYFNLLEASKLTVRYLREIDLMYQMFVDPITFDLLVEMKEPTDFRGLILRSCDMLLTDTHPDETDSAYKRIRGYERMAGAVYAELIKSIRVHNGRSGKSKFPIDLNPFEVWRQISKDPSITLVKDSNPVEDLKQVEAVTYSGTGGRNSRSMTKLHRIYHRNDMGTISEATVDSSDVAVNVYTSANPMFTSLRGLSKRYEIGKTGPTSLFSTSALLSPASDRDDAKRVNYVSIQQTHTIPCEGYHQAPLRTGYEQVIPYRTSDLFAHSAKKSGKVLSVNETGMVVQYEDGSTQGFELGRRYGQHEGLTIPHSVITEMKAGQVFKVGDMLCYNDGYFEKDLLNPGCVVLKSSVLVKTALLESASTLEDSSAISQRAANWLKTKRTKIKYIVVNFDQVVGKLKKVGEAVESEDILCVIQDAVTASAGLFDEKSLDTLRILSAQTPQAKMKGVIERIEVFYHGDKEDMSPSLRELATHFDKEMGKRYRSMGATPYTGSVGDGFRIEGEPLSLNTLAIKVYITGVVPAGQGD